MNSTLRGAGAYRRIHSKPGNGKKRPLPRETQARNDGWRNMPQIESGGVPISIAKSIVTR